MITGIAAIPAVRNIPSVAGEGHVRLLRRTQLGRSTNFAPSLARFQILRKIGGLSKRQDRPETKTGYLRAQNLPESAFHISALRKSKTTSVNRTDRNQCVVPAKPQSVLLTSPDGTYFLSSLASATFAFSPASDTALRNASALRGVATLPERMLRNNMCLPYMARVESLSCSTTAPSKVRPANAPFERE